MTMVQERLQPPANIEAEQGLFGAILVNNRPIAASRTSCRQSILPMQYTAASTRRLAS